MSSLLKRKLFIQAVSYSAGPIKVQVSEMEFQSSGFVTYVTLGTTDIEFECDVPTIEQFTASKAEQLKQLKDTIMQNAQKQCDALGG